MPAIAAPNPNDARIKQLTAESFSATDPQQQKQIYEEILKLDPNNVMAANGYQQASQKLDAANATRSQQELQQEQQSQAEQQNQAQAEAASRQAQNAFLAGDLNKADTQIRIAEKSLSNQPPQLPLRVAVDELRDRIESAIQARTRLRMIWGGVGITALIGMIALLWARSGKKDGYLEVISGLDKGRKFNLDQDVIHIGAIAEDGGTKNEIVIRDLERQISRFHCEIHKRSGKFFLIDCGSANGTRLDGRRLPPGKPVRIKSGARVELAGTSALRLGFGKKDAK
jgi:FHA domain